MEDAVRMYMQTKNRILSLSRTPQFRMEFGRNTEVITQALNIMFNQLDKLVKDMRTVPTDEERSIIASATKKILEKIVYDPITPFLVDFVSLYVEVATNWNMQIGRQYDMDLWLDTMQRLIQSHLTIKDAIDVMKKLTERCKRLLNYEPPAFTLARHYLQVIQDKMEKGEPINEYEKAKLKKCDGGECK